MSALVIYGLITVVCGLLLFVMAVFGADGDLDMDADVDLGFDADVGGLDAGGVSGPGVLSLKLIMIFLIGFGLSGFLAASFDCPLYHLIVALQGGAVLWLVSYYALKWLYMQQSSSHVRGTSFVGEKATVTVPIPQGGTGEVYARIGATGKSLYLNARAEDAERAYAKGEGVTIKSVEGTTAIVGQDSP